VAHDFPAYNRAHRSPRTRSNPGCLALSQFCCSVMMSTMACSTRIVGITPSTLSADTAAGERPVVGFVAGGPVLAGDRFERVVVEHQDFGCPPAGQGLE
jgi:hypothetical protein